MQRVTIVVTEIALLVVASALILSTSPVLSSYIMDYISKMTFATGGMLQVLNAEFTGERVIVDVKNMGPSALTIKGLEDFQIYVDRRAAVVESVVDSAGREFRGTWSVDVTIRVIARLNANPSERHIVILYGPGNTEAVYLYYPLR